MKNYKALNPWKTDTWTLESLLVRRSSKSEDGSPWALSPNSLGEEPEIEAPEIWHIGYILIKADS
jgi:hypothetical protein